MDRADILKKVISVTAETLDVDEGSLSGGSSFTELGADSFDLLELVTALEDEFGKTLPDDSLGSIATLGDAVDAIGQVS